MAEYIHRLEPRGLIDAFVAHPPAGFDVRQTPDGAPWFITRFDLLTTMDTAERQRVERWPGYRWWQRFLRRPACFTGTTVSEYSPLPYRETPGDYLRRVRRLAPQCALTIIKDLPCHSPLLPMTDNLMAEQLLEAAEALGFISIAGQALAYVPIHFSCVDEYLSGLSHSRRRNLRRKLRSRTALRVEIIPTGAPCFADADWRGELYRYYLAVYQQSEIHFDLLSAAFFDQVLQDPDSNGRLFCYWYGDSLAGFNLCYIQSDMLIDKYIGLDYSLARRFNLYFVSWFVNLEYALGQGLRYYVAGWTDPQVKAQLGASFTMTRHLVWVRNPLMRRLLRHLQHHFERDSEFVPVAGEAQ